MKEFTRVLTIEVTQVQKFDDMWAGDIEDDSLSETRVEVTFTEVE